MRRRKSFTRFSQVIQAPVSGPLTAEGPQKDDYAEGELSRTKLTSSSTLLAPWPTSIGLDGLSNELRDDSATNIPTTYSSSFPLLTAKLTKLLLLLLLLL